MSPGNNFLVLGDAAVQRILKNLKRKELIQFHDAIANSLRDFAVGDARSLQPSPSFINRPEGQKCIYKPFSSSTSMGTKLVVDPAGREEHRNANPKPGLNSLIAVCDANGVPASVINANEITGFRTSMSAMIPFMWRKNVEDVVVFGAGVQALWHGRLALGLRGNEIKRLTFINRSTSRAQELVQQLQKENAESWKSPSELTYLDTAQSGYQERLQSSLQKASAILCTVPSKEPLFPAKIFTNDDKRDRWPLITAIGSWQKEMIEIDPKLVEYTAHLGKHIDFAPQGIEQGLQGAGGAIVVDDRSKCMIESGEIAQSDVQEGQTIEVGDLVGRRADGSASSEVKSWMEEGFVLYKSVGIGLTDLIAAEEILRIAREKGEGTSIADF